MKPALQCPACSGLAGHYARKQGYAIFRCRECGTLFVYPDPSYGETSSIYDQSYFCGGGPCGGYTEYDKDKKAMKETFLDVLDLLQKENGDRGKLLDVGAATGYFVELAQEAGWDARGVEISEYAVEAARKKNLPVEQGTLLTFKPSENFDVVTLWDVFEHLTKPEEHLRVVSHLLKPGGIFALITPKADSLWARMMGAGWHLLIPPEHVVCYSAKGIKSLLQAHGFEVKTVRSVTKRFTLPYIFHIAKNWLGWTWFGFFEGLARRFLHDLTLPLNVHDNMFVIAKKSSIPTS